MANQEHLTRLLDRVMDWNVWRSENPDVIPDLSRALLYKAFLRKANLRKANLREADLRDADLEGVIR